jgi:membrane-associated phospholipid phosphatase
MDGLITFVAKYFILIPVVVIAYIFFKLNGNKKQEMLVYLFCFGVLSVLLAKIGAHLFDNPRPYISDGYSKKAGYALMAVAILIGWARVAAHVHHAVDVLGSLVITTIAYLMVSNLLNNEKIARKLNLNHASKRHHSDKG